jgi:hypothetical protein
MMRVEVVRAIAKSHGLRAGKRSKDELIKAIQSEEGNFGCYGTANQGVCDQEACLWRADCFDNSTGETS